MLMHAFADTVRKTLADGRQRVGGRFVSDATAALSTAAAEPLASCLDLSWIEGFEDDEHATMWSEVGWVPPRECRE